MKEFDHNTAVCKGSYPKGYQNHSTAMSQIEKPTIAYLGPVGTYTYEAALSVFGQNAAYQPCETIEDVFRWVEKNPPLRGVVPVENAYAGPVNRTMDLLYTCNVKIQGEIYSQIHLHLLSKVPSIEQIRCIYSHPMAIAQCRNWLDENLPHAAVAEVSSTAKAVKSAIGESHGAAIGSQSAGDTYGLSTLKENIEDYPDNATRFLVLGREGRKPTGKDKTSILVVLNHKPEALYKALRVLAERDILVARIVSRPAKTKKWEYVYFVDMEGHEKDHPIREAITELEKQCAYLKHLGSYPAGEESGLDEVS